MEQRTCLVCSGVISSIKGARAKYCSRDCASKAAKISKESPKPAGIVSGALIHACHDRSLYEPMPGRCLCKKRVSDVELNIRLERGEIVATDNGSYCWVGKHLRTPRTPTIESSHIERSVVSKKPKEHRLTQAQIDELLRMREETRVSFEQEARCRWDVYNEITQDWLRSLIVPFREDGWGEGRCLFSNSWEDERTSVGRTVGREYLPEVLDESEVATGDVIERDENVISLDESESEEFEYAAAAD